MRTSNPTCLNDVEEFKVCKVPASSDNNGRKCKHITFVLGFNYAFLTVDSPWNWIHTWVKKWYQI
jgi:hypothetical protein